MADSGRRLVLTFTDVNKVYGGYKTINPPFLLNIRAFTP